MSASAGGRSLSAKLLRSKAIWDNATIKSPDAFLVTGVRWNLNSSFICILLMASDAARFLHMFVGHLYSTSSFQNSLFVSFSYLLSRLFDFLVFGYFF